MQENKINKFYFNVEHSVYIFYDPITPLPPPIHTLSIPSVILQGIKTNSERHEASLKLN